jgi:hypothetical protein
VPDPVKVPRAIFDAIHRAWAADTTGKRKHSIQGTANACRTMGEREAAEWAEWIERHDYAFGCGVWGGFHIDGEYRGEVTVSVDYAHVAASAASAQTYEWPWNAQGAISGSAPSPSPQPAPRHPLTAEAMPDTQEGDQGHSDSPGGATSQHPSYAPPEPEEGSHPAEAGAPASWGPLIRDQEAPNPPADDEEESVGEWYSTHDTAPDMDALEEVGPPSVTRTQPKAPHPP